MINNLMIRRILFYTDSYKLIYRSVIIELYKNIKCFKWLFELKILIIKKHSVTIINVK